MITDSETPASPVSRQVYKLLWVSLALAFLIAFLGPFLGTVVSHRIPSVTCWVAMVHNIVLLVLLRKHRSRGDQGASTSAAIPLTVVPPTSTLASIICTWCLCVWFVGGFAFALAGLIIVIRGYRWLAIPELVLVGAEIGVLVTLALKSTRERGEIMGGNGTVLPTGPEVGG